MDGAAALALPSAHRLALVRDADGVGRHPGLADRFPRRLDGDAQDLLGVVLDLSRRWEVLRELAITAAEHAALIAQDECGAAGSSLIEREDICFDGTAPTENGG